MTEGNAKRKDKNKDDKKRIFSKALTSKSKVLEDGDDSSDDSSKDEDMWVFVRCYDKYMRMNGLKHHATNLMKFTKFYLRK